MLGANPRKQLIAQLFGVIAGTLFVVPVPALDRSGRDRERPLAGSRRPGLGGGGARAPAGLPCPARRRTSGLLIGGAVGVVLAAIEDRVPKHLKKYTLSSTPVGIAFVIPAWNSISMFIGGFLAWVFARLHARKAERYSLAISAGSSRASRSLPSWSQH